MTNKFQLFLSVFFPEFTSGQLMQYYSDRERALNTLIAKICSDCFMKVTSQDITSGGENPKKKKKQKRYVEPKVQKAKFQNYKDVRQI